MRIDAVSPPFAGHLYPMLDLISDLPKSFNLKIMTTANGQSAAEAYGYAFHELLPGKDDQINDIADPKRRVGSHPWHLYRQLHQNLSLMSKLVPSLQSQWEKDRPDLVICDFALPIAGLLAERMGIDWWTSMATPCAIETRKGTPAYVGGWLPPRTPFGHLRDAIGRVGVRLTKLLLASLVRKQLIELGIKRLYRKDGTEVIYSPQKILALGYSDFEFERDWPASLEFIGAATASPPGMDLIAPRLGPEKNILVSLGTAISWAKKKARSRIIALAQMMPDCTFHFTLGRSPILPEKTPANMLEYHYLPYCHMAQFDAAIIHGGTGVMYSCLTNAVPMLVWPHDYDQFDHAARIVHGGLGLKMPGTLTAARNAVQQVIESPLFRKRLTIFQGREPAHKRLRTLLEDPSN